VKRFAPLAVIALVAALVPSTANSASMSASPTGTRPRWDTRVFASVPNPGFPAYVYKHPNGRVYAGTYTNPQGDAIRSRVFEWTAAGTLLRSWIVPGQNLKAEHGVQVATSDARGRLVLLEKSTRSVLTLNVRTGRFKRQAQLPAKSIPNYATWGPGGALFVSDYGRGVIWRIPARGGAPRAWFASKSLDGLGFGTTGLVYQPRRHAFLVGQQTTADLISNPAAGKLYRLAIRADGKPGALRTLWTSRIAELPDGFGVARSGRIYIANVGLSAQLVELAPDGRELERFPKTPLLGDNGSPVPFDGPSNATFLGTRVLVANQSPITGDRTHQVILDVEVGESGAAPYVPANSRLS
jgi:sugar lactone lactonase YvrE